MPCRGRPNPEVGTIGDPVAQRCGRRTIGRRAQRSRSARLGRTNLLASGSDADRIFCPSAAGPSPRHAPMADGGREDGGRHPAARTVRSAGVARDPGGTDQHRHHPRPCHPTRGTQRLPNGDQHQLIATSEPNLSPTTDHGLPPARRTVVSRTEVWSAGCRLEDHLLS
jgi:hypothetical protein